MLEMRPGTYRLLRQNTWHTDGTQLHTEERAKTTKFNAAFLKGVAQQLDQRWIIKVVAVQRN